LIVHNGKSKIKAVLSGGRNYIVQILNKKGGYESLATACLVVVDYRLDSRPSSASQEAKTMLSTRLPVTIPRFNAAFALVVIFALSATHPAAQSQSQPGWFLVAVDPDQILEGRIETCPPCPSFTWSISTARAYGRSPLLFTTPTAMLLAQACTTSPGKGAS
jgi:hypothetical protein